MNVLSLFDGMSCGQIALNKAGIKYDNYFASEINPAAIAVTNYNYPNTVQLGDVCNLKSNQLPKINLLIGGSPCQSLSFVGDGSGFDGKSKLFFEYIRLLKECNPDYFLLENVKMKKQNQDIITDLMGVDPIEINSKIFSAQSRPRLYWTNIPLQKLPTDNSIVVSDILDPNADSKYSLSDKARAYMERSSPKWSNGKSRVHIYNNELSKKSICLTANMFKGVPYGVIWELNRRFTPLECERLQTVPDHYTANVSDRHRYEMLGNGWNIETIKHLISPLNGIAVEREVFTKQMKLF